MTVETSDHPEEITGVLESIIHMEKTYCVLKYPSICFSGGQDLTGLGFTFFESQLNFKTTKREFARIQRDMGRHVTPRIFRLIDSSNADNLLHEFDKGIFQTDRIALNPAFGPTLANLRYKKWLISCLDKPEYRITETLWNGKPVGFGMDRLVGDRVIGLLGANYPGFEGKLSYINGMFDSTSQYFAEGYKVFVSSVSSNNIQIIRIFEKLGFIVADIQYVFTLTKK